VASLDLLGKIAEKPMKIQAISGKRKACRVGQAFLLFLEL
jgi:hypothetical protein